MAKSLNVLLIDDSNSDGLLIETIIRKEWPKLNFKRVDTAEEMIVELDKKSWSIILSDQCMPSFSANEALTLLNDSGQDIPFIVISGVIDMDFIINLGLLKSGADDFIEKDNPARLIPAINKAINSLQTKQEKQRAINALAVSESQYKTLYENAPIAYFSVGIDEKIFRCNRQAEILLGYCKEDLIGTHILDLYAETTNGKESAKKILVKLNKGNNIQNHELQMQRKDGSHIWVSLTMSPKIDAHGKVSESNSMVLDIDDSIRLKQQIIQYNKMESLGTLAGGIAHEHNNMLAIIIGNAELFNNSLDKENIEGKHYLKQILEASKRSADLVRQIMIFSRSEYTNRLPFDFSMAVAEYMNNIKGRLPKNIKIQLDIKKDCSPILADMTQIVDIIKILNDNAIESMHDGGTLKVSLRETHCIDCLVKCLPKLDKNCVQLIVEDSGCGIDECDIERIFDPFFTTKVFGKSSGLGLALTHSIIQNHRGKISIESTKNVGTKVLVCIPCKENITPKNTGQTKHQQNSRNKDAKGHILLVEDESQLLSLYQEALEIDGYQVTGCHDGDAAILLFQANTSQFDLVITDELMPKMTGSQLSKSILKLKPNTPIILISGDNSDDKETEILNLGIKKYLKKPVNITTFLGVVKKYLVKKK